MEQQYLLTGIIKNELVYAWFETEDELWKYANDNGVEDVEALYIQHAVELQPK